MQREELENLTQQLLAGTISPTEFVSACSPALSAELGNVTLDLDRRRRCGFPEVVFGEGKDVATLEKIFRRQIADGTPVLATRVSRDKATELLATFPQARYNVLARMFRIESSSTPSAEISAGTESVAPQRVAIVTAGTSDLPIAEEVRETLDWMGIPATLVQDVGVAGPHRLPAQLDKLRGAAAVVVVAGMEGALPSVVGGYVNCPVIGVPTSVGYGANFGGVSALLSMLNSCSSNVTVVNIDAGFKAGYVAGMIARQTASA